MAVVSLRRSRETCGVGLIPKTLISRPDRDRALPRRAVVPLLTCIALVGGGCGASSSSLAGSHADAVTTSSVSGASAPAALVGVRGRVLLRGEMPGYSPQGRRLVGINARSWVFVDETPPPQRSMEAAFLNHIGFVAGVRESLRADVGRANGLSTVEEFRSAAGARAELSSVVKQFLQSSSRSKPFAVARIPGARGLGQSDAGMANVNVAFVSGRYVYLVGAGGPTGGAEGPTRATVITGAQHLYHRTV
jgi:hypothetical protein